MANLTRLSAAILILLADGFSASAEETFLLQSVEEKYSSDVAKAEAGIANAEAESAKGKKLAAAVRLKAYKDRLVEVTKSGDFDKALAVKARVEQLEKEPESETKRPEKPTKVSTTPRPKETVKFGGHVYALIKDHATWHVAKRRCEEMGGHLVVLDSNEETDFILSLMNKSADEAWIGATDEEKEGEWKWITDQALSKAFLSRCGIDNAHGFQHALSIGGSKNIGDVSTSLRILYLCEWDR